MLPFLFKRALQYSLVINLAAFRSIYAQDAATATAAQDAESADEIYILPDFVVTKDDDKGYYSANSLAGTRTNELTKNIPMTISTVNEAMIEDFKMETLADLGNFVPSIESEENVYNNQEIRFRGFLSRSQLYEFMPRYSPLDYYNVGRADVIRGANSLIYGQADPGGKVNIISKTASFGKDKKSLRIEVGDKNYHKVVFDVNAVLSDDTAARYMATDNHREFDAKYKYQSFSGQTLELQHNLGRKTRLRFHIENGQADRSLIGGTFKVGNTPTGLPNGIVADPKLADLIEDDFLQYIVGFTNGDPGFTDEGDPIGRRVNDPKLWNANQGGTLIPNFISDRDDLSDIFAGIDNENSGTGFGPDSYSKRDFEYYIAELSHIFANDVEMKVSVSSEVLNTESLSSGYGANQIKFSTGYGSRTGIPNSEIFQTPTVDNPYRASLDDLLAANYSAEVADFFQTETEGEGSSLDEFEDRLRGKMTNDTSGNNGNSRFNGISGYTDDIVGEYRDQFTADGVLDANGLLQVSDYELAKSFARGSRNVQALLNTIPRNDDATKTVGYLWNWRNDSDTQGTTLAELVYGVFNEEDTAPASAGIREMALMDQFIDLEIYRTYAADNQTAVEDLIKTVTGDWMVTNNGGMIPLPGAEGENLPRLIVDPDQTEFIEDFTSPNFGLPNPNFGQLIDNPELEDYNQNGTLDTDAEYAAQREAIASYVYQLLDPENNDNADFWRANQDVINFFKYQLHQESDLSFMWNTYIAPDLYAAIDQSLEADGSNDRVITSEAQNSATGDLNPTVSKFSIDFYEPFIERTWAKQTSKDENQSARVTFTGKTENWLLPGKQQWLLGLDLDKRRATVSQYQQFMEGTRQYSAQFYDGSIENANLRNDVAKDYVTVSDLLNNSSDASLRYDDQQQGHQYGTVANSLVADYKLSSRVLNQTSLFKTEHKETEVATSGLWLAASGSYMKGRLRSLIGLRRDQIKVDSSFKNFKIRDLGADAADTYVKGAAESLNMYYTTPSIGGLYWMTQKLAVFGNYSKSVISPTGFQFDVFGDLTPPETGEGVELGLKFSSEDGKLNAQLAAFQIDKKNEQRSHIAWSQLTSVYPAKDPQGEWMPGFVDESGEVLQPNDPRASDSRGLYIIEEKTRLVQNELGDVVRERILDDEGRPVYQTIFDPVGYRVADEEARSQGLELDFYYNPTDQLSLFLGYAFLDTTILKSSLKPLEGLTVPGTSKHNLNFQFRYKFNEGNLKGFTVGFNQKYRSAALLNNYFTDLDGDGDQDYFTHQVDGVDRDPKYYSLYLEDQFQTDVFIKWGGKLAKGRHIPWTTFQLNINNIFDDARLISTGANNARYTEGRTIRLSAGIYF
jgi:outer membrane receptor protein involved in Fe transport